MIIHSYFTDGLYDWAKIFVESYVFYHGNNHKIFLSSRDLPDEKIKELEDISSCVIVKNQELNFNKIAKRAKLPVKRIRELKNHIENNAVTKNTFIWKQAISVEDRYRNSIKEAMDFYPNEDYLIHFDIDMYFRIHLKQLFKIVRSNEISIKFRLKSKLNRKVMGGLIGFKLGQKTNKFMDRWIYHIDKIPLYKKPIGYGQTSFYYAYKDLVNNFKWGHIPSKFISPRFQETDAIWSGNTTKGKAANLRTCRKDFEKRKL